MKAVLTKISLLKPQFEVNTNLLESDVKNLKVSKKKNHEIELLSPIIHEICNQVNSKHVIDVGSGLVSKISNKMCFQINSKITGLFTRAFIQKLQL